MRRISLTRCGFLLVLAVLISGMAWSIPEGSADLRLQMPPPTVEVFCPIRAHEEHPVTVIVAGSGFTQGSTQVVVGGTMFIEPNVVSDGVLVFNCPPMAPGMHQVDIVTPGGSAVTPGLISDSLASLSATEFAACVIDLVQASVDRGAIEPGFGDNLLTHAQGALEAAFVADTHQFCIQFTTFVNALGGQIVSPSHSQINLDLALALRSLVGFSLNFFALQQDPKITVCVNVVVLTNAKGGSKAVKPADADHKKKLAEWIECSSKAWCTVANVQFSFDPEKDIKTGEADIFDKDGKLDPRDKNQIPKIVHGIADSGLLKPECVNLVFVEDVNVPGTGEYTPGDKTSPFNVTFLDDAMFTSFTGGGDAQADVKDKLTHEIGHQLGLKHAVEKIPSGTSVEDAKKIILEDLKNKMFPDDENPTYTPTTGDMKGQKQTIEGKRGCDLLKEQKDAARTVAKNGAKGGGFRSPPKTKKNP